MLIGTICGPTIEKAKSQIERANQLCDGAELRLDLFSEFDPRLISQIKGVSILKTLEETKLKADYIDLPWDYPDDVTGSKVIRSYHNFEKTPSNLEDIFNQMPKAHLYKIACRAHSTLDALRMLAFVKKRANVIGICMGELGQITRILAPIVGSVFNYVVVDQQLAPGQMSVEELTHIYNYRQLNGQTKIYALIGDPVSQSPGHLWHNAFFRRNGLNAIYVKIEVLEEELEAFFSLSRGLGISGLSVTMPHKENIFPYIDKIESQAKDIGAINTLKFEGGKIFAWNTDGKGALDAIEEKMRVESKTVIILGAGGAAKAIAYEAKKRGATNVIFCNRSAKKAKECAQHLGCSFGSLKELPDYDILINTTPHPLPIDPNQLIPGTLVMDISIKNKTALMKEANDLGCKLIFGKEMFEKQAFGQLSTWFNQHQTLSL